MSAETSSANLLTRRLSLVAAVSERNAEALKLTQALAGLEMDVLRIELAIGRSAPTEQLVRDLHEASEKADAMRTALSDCSERIAAAERAVEEVDRLLDAVR